MVTTLFFLLPIVATVASLPLDESTLNDRSSDRNEIAQALVPSETAARGVVEGNAKEHSEEDGNDVPRSEEDEKSETSVPPLDDQDDRTRDDSPKSANFESLPADVKGKAPKKGRKHKAIFIDYPFVPRIANFPTYDSYDDLDTESRTPGGRKRYQESNIYYIRLPPTPYMFVPGLGYISQPPTYSTAPLRPQIAHVRPYRPQGIYRPQVNPFINLPLDFVSNGKPTSVYQWHGATLKPLKRPDSPITTLDKGPYFFNGRPTSLYLLRPDAQPSVHQSIQYPDYQDSAYY